MAEPGAKALPGAAAIKRNMLLLTTSQALVGVGNQMVPTLSAIMVVTLLGSASLAGIGVSILGISRFVVAYPVGKLSDTYGRRLAVTAGLVLGLVGTLIIGASMAVRSFPLMVAGLLVFGMGTGAAMQLRVAAADMYPAHRRGAAMGYVLTGSLVGAIGGPLLIQASNRLSPRFNLDPLAMPWLLVPIFVVPGILFVLRMRPDPKEIAQNLAKYYPGYVPPSAEVAETSEDQGIAAYLRHYPKLLAFVANFAAWGAMPRMMAMTSLALDHHGHDLSAVSVAIAIHVMGMFAFSLPFGRAADRYGRKSIMLFGLIVQAVGSVLVPATHDYWTITFGTFLVGAGWSAVTVSATALLADTTASRHRGRVIGASDAVSAAAAVVMPLAGGPMAEQLGLPVLGIVSVAVLVVPAAMLVRLRETSPGKYADAAPA